MTPPPLDDALVARRLRLLRETLDDLTELRDVDSERLASEHLTRAAAERLIQVAVDLAVDVNAHVAVSLLGEAPATGRASFEAMADAGVLSGELVDRIAPASGLRNILVHRYADIDVALVASAIGGVLDGFAEYVRQVAAFVAERRSGAPGEGRSA